MKIDNSTKWETSDLRKLFARCIQEVKKVEGRGQNARLIVHVRNSRRRDAVIHGRGYIGRYEMIVLIGAAIDLETEVAARQRLARVFIHEFYHNLGYRSQDHRHYRNDWTKGWDVDFVESYSIRKAQPRPKPKRDIQMERYEKVVKKVAEYEAKLKRTKNLLKKWKQKEKYYTRVLTAAGKIKAE